MKTAAFANGILNASRLAAVWSPLDRLRRSVVLRLFAIVFAFSCIVTLVLTAVQLYRDYRAGVELIQTKLSDIDRSYRDTLAEALWRLDRGQLELEVDGIVRFGDISAVEIREMRETGQSPPMVITAGERSGAAVVSRDFPIMRNVQGAQRMIGALHVEATLTDLYRSLRRTAAVILVSQAANTFLVALFITFLLNRLVTRHLSAIARTVDNYDFREAPRLLVLDRARRGAPDELDRMVAAFNAMGARLYRAYLDERGAAAEREARRAAEAANQAKSAFLASMSHELRTPLNGILGYAQMLKRDDALTERQRRGVAVILRCGEHLLALIHDVLDFATIEAGRLRIDIGEVPLREVIAGVRDVIAVKATSKGLAFVCDVEPDVPPCVHADERRLRQVLLNLLTNAVKFTARGSIGLYVTRSASGGARFEVRDTGIGIHPDHQEAIFQPFEQAVRAGGRDGGVGLGLAISRQFARAMGAELTVKSGIGKGSVFCFELAAAASVVRRAAEGALERAAIGYEGERHTVLVVDDMEVNRAVVSAFLTDLGFVVKRAASAVEGMAKLRDGPVSLVLTDIVMPDVDGIEFIRLLRTLPGKDNAGSVPVIAMSASSLQSNIERTLAAGADAFLSKPLDFDRLLAEIAAMLKLRWTYDIAPSAPASIVAAPFPDEPMATPLAERMAQLHRLARMGDMLGVRRWADQTAANPRHAPFAAVLQQLAKAYQSKQLLAFIERHLEGDVRR